MRILIRGRAVQGWGHGADAAAVNDKSTGFKNASQHETQFKFVSEVQGLTVV